MQMTEGTGFQAIRKFLRHPIRRTKTILEMMNCSTGHMTPSRAAAAGMMPIDINGKVAGRDQRPRRREHVAGREPPPCLLAALPVQLAM
ncbi:hypothetical protein [Streptomyces chartreusis]|uniref:hypothetical protein n=1 Tax=Streptomyces chartreusis TaxID=1969 RepID=UPI002E7FC5EE|nr:hypothetical protein [Streptomyces chartreusis]WUB15264.1 hypothetical protein OG997_00520 [Streptomyces chartreusis]